MHEKHEMSEMSNNNKPERPSCSPLEAIHFPMRCGAHLPAGRSRHRQLRNHTEPNEPVYLHASTSGAAATHEKDGTLALHPASLTSVSQHVKETTADSLGPTLLQRNSTNRRLHGAMKFGCSPHFTAVIHPVCREKGCGK